jgi:predicted metalloprotease with PDZ domain
MSRRIAAALALLVLLPGGPRAQPGIHYRFSFPQPQHRWMQVELRLTGIGDGPIALRMSRSSPGRYSLHDFAKNVYDVKAARADGREVAVARTDPHGWTVTGHGGAATIHYKVFGDRLDGTYLAIDRSHAHINMPAAVMWAKGLDDRPVSVQFEPPAGSDGWRVATQLYAGASPLAFTAPNLQYLMDSPVEYGPIVMREFFVDGDMFRVALHHSGSSAEVDDFVKDVERIVREQREIFGEFPRFEPGHYTFLADYLPYAVNDGMEHRNSTVLTAPASLGAGRSWLLSAVAHEFFHVWNVERIRPQALEPFDFENVNMSGELWLAEGFTQYFGPLTLIRAGLLDFRQFARTIAGMVTSVASNPARLVRSAEEMSQMAAFTDLGRPLDPTNWSQTYISYYSFGAALALALDLTLRERTAGRVTLDDYMRAMWIVHGKPGGARVGFVDRPYSLVDVEGRLAEISGDARLARDFIGRFVQGREVADFGRLLLRAGLVVRKTASGRAWAGDLDLESRGGAVFLTSPPPFTSPMYGAGLNVDDEIRQVDGTLIRSPADLTAVLDRRRPGDTIPIAYIDRSGGQRTSTLVLTEDPTVEVIPVEQSGQPLTAAQRAFRERWVN